MADEKNESWLGDRSKINLDEEWGWLRSGPGSWA